VVSLLLGLLVGTVHDHNCSFTQAENTRKVVEIVSALFEGVPAKGGSCFRSARRCLSCLNCLCYSPQPERRASSEQLLLVRARTSLLNVLAAAAQCSVCFCYVHCSTRLSSLPAPKKSLLHLHQEYCAAVASDDIPCGKHVSELIVCVSVCGCGRFTAGFTAGARP
jgi:hypothetical protein